MIQVVFMQPSLYAGILLHQLRAEDNCNQTKRFKIQYKLISDFGFVGCRAQNCLFAFLPNFCCAEDFGFRLWFLLFW